MKKVGFTLSEILVTLSIIGIVAATTVPLVSGIIPDKNKVAVLKTYKMVTDINESMLNDLALYYPTPNAQNVLGLDRTLQPTVSPYDTNSIYAGSSKYMALLAAHLKTRSTSITAGAETGSFTTQDGIVWNFTAPRAFTIDINPNGGNNCTYSSKCSVPDQFSFLTQRNGTVVGDDPLSKAYLANPFKLNDRKSDYKTAQSDSAYQIKEE